MSRTKISKHEGKPCVDVTWPDGIRSRIRFGSDAEGEELCLRIKLSILDSTWTNLRTTVLGREEKALVVGLFSAMADLYFAEWVLPRNKSIKSKRTFLSRFKDRFGRMPFAAFTLRHVDKYVAERKREGIKNSSINRELACLRHLYGWATDREFILRNPLERIKKLQEEEWAGPRATDEIIEEVFAQLDPVFVGRGPLA